MVGRWTSSVVITTTATAPITAIVDRLRSALPYGVALLFLGADFANAYAKYGTPAPIMRAKRHRMKTKTLSAMAFAMATMATQAIATTYHIEELSQTIAGNWGVNDHNARGQRLVTVSHQDGHGNSIGTALDDNGAFIDLPGLGVPMHAFPVSSWATSINSAGQVIGQTLNSDPDDDRPLSAWIFDHGVTTSLIAGHFWGMEADFYANAINDSGQVVGQADLFQWGDYSLRAFVWNGVGTMRFLDDLLDPASAGWRIDAATGIDARGDIIGTGHFGENGLDVGVMAIPDMPTNPSVTTVPEPETYALMLAGLGMVGAGRRRVR